jgi:hypothetical protein
MRQKDGIPMGLFNKREKRTFEGLENLTKFMVSPQHSMGDGYARRPCDNCWDGKSTRDVDEGVLSTYCTGCATLNEQFASEEGKGDQEGEDVHLVLLQGWPGTEQEAGAAGRGTNSGGLGADPRHQQPTGEAGGHSREALLRGVERNLTLR